MRCTECNKEIKPVVAIDIDGTMGIYHRHFLEFAAGYLNKELNLKYIGAGSFKAWFCGTYNVSTEVWHDIKLAYRQGSLKRTMPVYPGASNLCAMARDMGAEVWVTTTRPYIRHDNIDPDTREWLIRNKIPYDYLMYDGNKYQKLAQLVGTERVVAVLDDLLEEIEHAGELFGIKTPILRINGFNSAYQSSDFAQALNLPMAQTIIRERLDRWELTDGTSELRQPA